MTVTTTNYASLAISTLTKASCDTFTEDTEALLSLNIENETLGVVSVTLDGATPVYVSAPELRRLLLAMNRMLSY